MLSRFSVAVLRGQWISILIAGTGFFQTSIAFVCFVKYFTLQIFQVTLLIIIGIFATVLSDTSPSSNFPMLMNCCNYLLLSTYIFRQRKGIPLNRRLYVRFRTSFCMQ